MTAEPVASIRVDRLELDLRAEALGLRRSSGAPRSTPISPRCNARSRRCGTAACCCCTTKPCADGVFRGAYLETDYASFAAWRAWGRPPAGVHDCFGAAAVVGRRRRVSARRHGPAHLQCRAHLFSLRHARSGRRRGRHGRSRFAACGANSRRRPGSTPADSSPEPGWTTRGRRRLIAQIKVLRSRRKRRSLARAHARASGARAAAGACRHPHRARACRFRSRRCRAS